MRSQAAPGTAQALTCLPARARLRTGFPFPMWSTLRLLIVDDDRRTRSALIAYLTALRGMTVIGEASNGEEAISVLQGGRPDLVLMDVRMPVMGGIETIRRIKDQWPNIKIVVLSVYAESRLEAEAAGADAFLLKGCPLERLITTLRFVASK